MKIVKNNNIKVSKDGVYPAVIQDVELQKDKVRITFRLRGSGETFTKSYDAVLMPNTRLADDVETIMGKEFRVKNDETEFNVGDLHDKNCGLGLSRRGNNNIMVPGLVVAG